LTSPTSMPRPSKSDTNRCLDLGDMMPAFNESSASFDCFPLASSGPCDSKLNNFEFETFSV
jgi:hypothetical protein